MGRGHHVNADPDHRRGSGPDRRTAHRAPEPAPAAGFLSGGIALWHAYVMMAVGSAMQGIRQPAAASTAMLAPRQFLPRAAGLNRTLASLTIVGAAPLGALAIGFLPIGFALSIDVVTAVLGIIPLLIFRIPQPDLPEDERADIRSEFRGGLRLVWGHHGLRHLYILLGRLGSYR